PLNAAEALDILKARIVTFRKNPPAGKQDLFPYEEDAIKYLFSDGEKGIGYFFDVCHCTLGITIKELSTGKSKSPTVTRANVKRYIEGTLQQAQTKEEH